MRYYDITNSVIVSERQILKANPNTSFALPLSDAALADLNMAKLLEDDRPSFDADTQQVIDGAVEERDGSYYQTFSVIDRPAEAIANDLANKKANIRAQRNARLTETDWAMMPDSPLIDYDKSVMADYRAALRDVPAQAGFPNNPLPEGPDQRPSGGGQGELQPSIPFASWTYNTTTFVWEPPIPKPDGQAIWDEYAYQADNTTGWITF
jgi:hypothetical protein